jgi:hypothetical protein
MNAAAASDLAEGLLNNTDRPPVFESAKPGAPVLFPNAPVVCFNEADEGAGLDAIVTNRVWTAMSEDPATSLYDIGYGEMYQNQFVWVLEISGAVPPAHFRGGYAGASSERQPPMYFRRGGGTIKGISRAGEIMWSRVYVKNHVELHCDIGRATVLELLDEENLCRWKMTTSQWPMMQAVLHGVSRDQFMARHKANHTQVAYGSSESAADHLMMVKATVMHSLGIRVHIAVHF